jgi:hypothetical protein
VTGDAEFLEAFEQATLPPERLRHRDHVRLAWLYLERLPPARALERFSEGLRRFAAVQGKASLYHETITWAFLLLIHERRQRFGAEGGFEAFASANPDLLTWKPSILDALYEPATLSSDLARRTFVLPDRARPSAVAAVAFRAEESS